MPLHTFTQDASRSIPASDALSRLVDHARSLLPVDAVAFLELDEEARTVALPLGWFADPVLGDALRGSGPVPLDQRLGTLVTRVLANERSLLLPRLDAWRDAPQLLDEAVASLGPERARALWRRYRAASLIACPLRVEGEAVGALVVATLSGRSLTGPDARTLEALTDLAAVALGSAARVDAGTEQTLEELRMARVTATLSTTLELDEVCRRVVEHAADLTGASEAALTRAVQEGPGWPGTDRRAGAVREGPGSARTGPMASREGPGSARTGPMASREGPGWSGPERRSPGRFQRGPGQGLAPFAQADLLAVARERRPVLVTAEYPGSLMHVPVELGNRLYGVLSVWHSDDDRFGADELARLAELARSAELAIANASDYERERRVASTLTRGFVPSSLPDLPGYDVGLIYAPALAQTTGGDVYGVWAMPDGRTALLVGDVAGKGVEAAALSSMVRFFAEARSWDAANPATVLEHTNAMLLDRLPEDTFITALLAFLGPASLHFANAGHLPALHVSADEVRELGDPGLPLGVSDAPSYSETEVGLAQGDLVFAYTDGLVEARRGAETYGIERLARLVQDRGRTLGPQDLTRAVHEEVSGWADGLSDDAVALAVLRR